MESHPLYREKEAASIAIDARHYLVRKRYNYE
jgi:hypothetical protein